MHGVELHLLLASIGPDAPRRLGREIKKGPDGAARALPGTQFQHLTEQDENRDHGRGLEIHRDGAVGASEGRREYARRECRNHAVDPGDARAHGDEREHVEAAVHDRLPAAHEQRPARPQYDRSTEQELKPVRVLRPEHLVKPGHVAAHLEREHGQGEHRADPEAAREVGELRIRAGLGADEHRFQGHAADRARAGPDLPDLGMHRAGVDRALWQGLGLRGGDRRFEVARGIGQELLAAPG